jgi:hypothetical protein
MKQTNLSKLGGQRNTIRYRQYRAVSTLLWLSAALWLAAGCATNPPEPAPELRPTNEMSPAPRAKQHLPLNAEKTSVPDRGRYVETKVQVADGSPARLEGSIHVWNKVGLIGWRGTALIDLKDERGNIIYRQLAPCVPVNAYLFAGHDKTYLFGAKLTDDVAYRVRSVEIMNLSCDHYQPPPIEETRKLLDLVKRAK